jgi:hypothetical protein
MRTPFSFTVFEDVCSSANPLDKALHHLIADEVEAFPLTARRRPDDGPKAVTDARVSSSRRS